jgi:hypothetical protein
MSVHEQMSDDEVLHVVAGLLSALPVPEPPEAKAIMARGRTRRHRRRTGTGLAATAAADHELRAAPRARLARRLLTWRGPVAAVAVVLLVAATLVALRSARNEHAVPAASPSPIAGPPLPAGAIPRYYVTTAWVNDAKSKKGIAQAWVAGDAKTGKQIGYVLLPGPQSESGLGIWEPIAGAADDRTFVAAESVTRQAVVKDRFAAHRTDLGMPILESLRWYLLRIFPGSADPVRLTTLPIPSTAAYGSINAMALSGDGTELAVAYRTGKLDTLRVYSVATGQPQHAWSATGTNPVTDLSWVGDSAVGFSFGYAPQAHEEVRTLNISAAGTGLLADSHVVWSQDVPQPSHGVYHEGTPQACGTPFLTGNGQAVVCATSTYSASDKRLSAVWLAYPVAAPTRARVLGSVPQPKDVSSLDPPGSVQWTNASGTEVIGMWSPTVITFPGSPNETSTTTNYIGIVGGGTVRPFTTLKDPDLAAW